MPKNLGTGQEQRWITPVMKTEVETAPVNTYFKNLNIYVHSFLQIASTGPYSTTTLCVVTSSYYATKN